MNLKLIVFQLKNCSYIFILVAVAFLNSFSALAQEIMYTCVDTNDSCNIVSFNTEPPSFYTGKYIYPSTKSESHFINKHGELKLFTFGDEIYNSKGIKMPHSIYNDSVINNQTNYYGSCILPSKDSTVFYYLNNYKPAGVFSTVCCTKIDLSLHQDTGDIDTLFWNRKLIAGKYKNSYIPAVPHASLPFHYWLLTYKEDTLVSWLFADGKIIDSVYLYIGHKNIATNIAIYVPKFGHDLLGDIQENKKYFVYIKYDAAIGTIENIDTIEIDSTVSIPYFYFKSVIRSPNQKYAYYLGDKIDTLSKKMLRYIYQYSFDEKKSVCMFMSDTNDRNSPTSFIYNPNGSIYVEQDWGNFTRKYGVIKNPNEPFPYTQYCSNSNESVSILNAYQKYQNVLVNGFWNNYDPTQFHQVHFTYTGYCDSIRFVNTSDTSFYKKYIWYFGADSIQQATDSIEGFEVSYKFKSNSSKEWVKLKAISKDGYYCWFSDTVYKFVKPSLLVEVDTNSFCINKAVAFKINSFTDSVNYYSRGYWYSSFGDGRDTIITNSLINSDSFNVSLTYQYQTPGFYIPTFIYYNGFCSDTFSLSNKIEILELPTKGIYTFDGYCVPQLFTITDTSSNVSSRYYNWGDGEDTTFLTPAAVKHIYRKAGQYMLSSTLIHHNGCIISDSQQLDLYDKPIIDFGVDTTFCKGETLWLKGPLGNYKYLWNTGDTIYEKSLNKEGKYVLEVSNGLCISKDSINIYQSDEQYCGFTIDVFSNPFDGQIKINGFSFEPSDIQIDLYDITGRKVFDVSQVKVLNEFNYILNTSSISSGIYFIRITQANKQYIYKLMLW